MQQDATIQDIRLKFQTEFSLRKVSFLNKRQAMDNIQNCDSYTNIPSAQTYR
jgi:hypothetical protein